MTSELMVEEENSCVCFCAFISFFEIQAQITFGCTLSSKRPRGGRKHSCSYLKNGCLRSIYNTFTYLSRYIHDSLMVLPDP